jgi:hypothetical protein
MRDCKNRKNPHHTGDTHDKIRYSIMMLRYHMLFRRMNINIKYISILYTQLYVILL